MEIRTDKNGKLIAYTCPHCGWWVELIEEEGEEDKFFCGNCLMED